MGRVNQRQQGGNYEKMAAAWLERHGYVILQMNYRCRFGEVDIVARDGPYLVFVEVKYRKDASKGEGEYAVGPAKQHKICMVARFYCMMHGIREDHPIRMDVVAILGDRLKLYQNAFEWI